MLVQFYKKVLYFIVFLSLGISSMAQVPVAINSGNPNFPFPQFKDYNSGALKTLASSGQHPEGVTHAEMELRIREAYGMICNNMTYNVNQNGTYGPLTVNGVKYIMPNVNPNTIMHCTCVEADAYYLLAAAYMADKATFDGYYMWMHDRQFQKTIRFVDGVMNSPTYGYSPGISGAGSAGNPTNVYGGALGGNSATDGDEDLAMALLVAWKQWGDNAVICNDPIQGAITYKNETLKYLKTMVDTVLYPPALPIQKYNSGIVGLDGYLKNGDSWNEITDWAAGSSYLGIDRQVTGNQFLYMDYSAPSYFNTFSKVLTVNGSPQFFIDQYDRATASCDWLVGQMASQDLIGFAGKMNLSTSNVPTFTSFNDGEDFRVGWRTVLNYVWNGNPTTSWDPVAHQPVAGGNTFELDFAKNNEKFLLSPQTYYAPNPQAPYTLPTLNLNICGPSTMTTYQPPTGANSTYFRLNKAFGPFSVSALAVQNFPLMAQMYRKCEITWDGADAGQQYLNSKPLYFHEFFRFLGMMVLTGNWHNPLDMIPTANMKVYKSVNKTYAYHGDTLTYTISYRNFGKPNALNVVITDALPSGLTYLSQVYAGPGVSVSNSGGSLTWTIATVSGTNIGIPSNLNKTKDSIVFKVLVNNTATGRLCNTVTINTSNGTGATSNEYPNHITETMERNCVDILTDNPISIKKSASKSLVQVGDTLSYTIVVKNKSVGFLNGGRPGVRVSVGLQPFTNPATELKMDFRVFHGADEAYINLKNYRVSYFLQEPGPPNWSVAIANAEGFGTTNPTIGTQTLTPGTGYNHRFFITFPDQLTTVTQHLAEYAGSTGMVHRGALAPPRLSTRVYTNPTGSFNFLNDWSYGTELNGTSSSSDLLTLITNDWTDPNNPNIPINKYHPEACGTTSRLSNKLLVEEFDGYTWRRAFGNSPVAGRELLNVKVIDSLPNGVVFGGFTTGYPVGTVSGNKIAWPTITQMLVNDSIVYKFWVTVKDAAFFGCPNSPTPANLINTAYASATNEQTVKDTALTAVTCTAVFIPLKNFTKKADKTSYNTGDPITYTIGWKNTQGSIVSSVGTASNWNQITGNPFTFSGANMLINGIGPNGATGSNLMINNTSHGMNGVIKSSIALAGDQTNYALVFRQNGNNKWYEVRLKKVYNGIEISLWDYGYTTAGTYSQRMATTTNTAFPAGFTTVDIQLTLLNGQASFSVVNGGVTMPGVAQYTQLGLQQVAGYAGWRSDNNSSSTVSAWYTNLDSAFDIKLTDPIPSDVTFVSANNAVLTLCASCGSTPVVGTNVAGTVTYSQLAGPILYNDSITYTWKGTVASCPSDGKILNVASMAIKGITPSILATNTVTCGSTTTCTKPTITSLVAGSVCSGTAQSYAITSSLPSTYAWTRAVVSGISNLIGSGSTATITETLTNTTAAAVVVRYIITPTSTAGACVGNPFNYDVTVNPLPTITGSTTVCVGSTITLTGSATAHATTPWVSGTPANATVTNAGVVTGVAAGTSVITYMNTNGCTQTHTVTVNAKPTITGSTTVCVGSTITLTGSVTVHATTPWVSGTPANATVTNAGVVTGVAAGTSAITYMNTNGCTQTQTITVNPKPTITGASTVCAGSTITLAGSATAHATTPWTSGTLTAATVTPAGVVTGVAAGTSVITYMNTNGCTQTQTITVNDAPGISGTLSACVGLTTQLTGTTTAATTTPWVSATPAVATVDNTGLVTGVSGGSSIITYTNSDGCKATATVTIHALPTISGTVNVCIGSATQLTGSATAGTAPAWVSGSPLIATVDNTGLVSGVAAGTSVITYTNNNGCIKTATVTVNALPTITGTLAVCIGSTTALTGSGTAAVSNAWVSATPSVATVSNAGIVTGVTEGTSIITYTNDNGCKATATVTVSTTAAAAVTLNQTPGGTICEGTNVTFTANVGNGGTPTYVWTSSVNGTLASTADTYSSAGLVNGETITVDIVSSLGCAIPNTASANTIMVVDTKVTPTISITASKTTICPSESVDFSILSETNGGVAPNGPTYQWRKNGSDILHATNTTYTAPATSIADGDKFNVVMTTGLTCVTATVAAAAEITITVTLAPTIAVSVNPGITSICANNPVQFTATASGAGATPAPTYEWFVTSASTATGGSSQGTPSTTATTFTTSALTATNNKVYVQVVSNAPCAAATAVASNVVSITVNTGIGAGTIGSDQSICYNTPASAFTELTASDAVTPTYVWEASTSTGGTYIPIPGATNTTYSPPAVGLTQDLYLHRIVTDGSVTGTCNNATSNEVYVKVNPQLAAGVIGSDQTLCSGVVPAVMTETTAPTGGTGSYTYQWQSDAAAVGVFADISGATNSSYTSAALTRTTKFQRIETSGTCGSVTSNIVEKTITTPEVVSVSLNNPGQVCTGSAAFNFIATAATSGTGTLSYAWSIINPTTLVSTPIGSNSPNDSYSPLIDDHSKLIQVVVTTSNGCNAGPATASVALDIVSAATPTVTIATNDNPNCIGFGTTFTATTTAGGTNPQYQWYTIPFGSSTPQAVGTGGITYTTSTLADGDIVYVSLSSSLSCLIGTNPFKSNEITMDMKPTPAPSITEGDQTICSSNSFTFHGNVTAGNTYEWRLNNQPTGITTADIRATQNGTYTLIEDNGACNSISQPVTLNVIQTPQANAGTDIYLKEGDEGSLNGSGGAIYSWSPATYLSNAAVSNPSFTATTTITYILTVSDVANPLCATTDDVTVFVVKPVEVPNVITVNGDGSNDDWEIKNIDGYPNVIIEIYNRWGNLVWKSEGYPKNWDGTNFRNGQLLSDGTYFYIINLQSQVYPEPLTGWVQIMK